MKAAEPSFADSGFHFVSLCLRARYFRFSFWTPSTLILDSPCAEPLKPCLAQRRKDTKYFYYLSRSLHSGHPVRSFWTPVLHGVFSSPWRVALRRNRFPIPVMTEHNPPKQPFWTPVTLILDIPCAEPIKPFLARRHKDTEKDKRVYRKGAETRR